VTQGVDAMAATNDGFSAAFIGASVIAFVAAGLATVAIRSPRSSR
jgi:hypothetical protein